jgi:cysteine desulfurase
MPPEVYLDYAATTPIEPAAVAAQAAVAQLWANPSSVHRAGRRAHAALEDAREGLAHALGCQPEALIFTSGGTEALGLALRGVQAASVLVSAVEHDAVLAQAEGATRIKVDGEGRVDLAALAAVLASAPAPALVAVMQVNNETGVLQPLKEIAALVHNVGGRLLVDAVQGAGKLPCPPGDFIAVSAHKFGGPPGVGALIARCAEDLIGQQRGGGQERGFRAGTQNLPGVAGFAAALAARSADTGWLARAEVLRDRLEARLLTHPGARILGSGAARLPTISCIAMPGVPATTQVMALDLAGFAVSAGAACSSGKVKPSHVLAAMGVAHEIAATAIRVSLGWNTTEAEIDAFADAWLALATRQAVKAA